MTDKKQTKNLIEELAQETAPVKPAMSPVLKTCLFVIAALLYISFMVWAFYTPRQDLISKFSTLSFGIEQFIALLVGVLAAAATFWIATPGKEGEKTLRYAAVLLLLLLSCCIFFGEDLHGSFHSIDFNTLLHGAHCSVDIMIFALPPLILLLYLIKKLAPTSPALAGLFAALSVTAFGYFAVRSTCAQDSVQHQMLSHLVPLFIYIAVGYFVGRKFLRW